MTIIVISNKSNKNESQIVPFFVIFCFVLFIFTYTENPIIHLRRLYNFYPKDKESKGKINQWDYIKLNTSLQQKKKKTTKQKGNQMDRKRNLQTTALIRVYYQIYIKNSDNSTSKK